MADLPRIKVERSVVGRTVYLYDLTQLYPVSWRITTIIYDYFKDTKTASPWIIFLNISQKIIKLILQTETEVNSIAT